MLDLLVLSLLIGAASYRVWRLLAHDRILNRLRAKIPEDSWFEYWLGCPWCSGLTYNVVAVGLYIMYTQAAIIDGALILGAATVVTGVLGDRL